MKDNIINVLQQYSTIININQIQSYNLSYLYYITIADREFEKYLNFRPLLNRDLPKVHGPFMVGVDFLYNQYQEKCQVQLNGDIKPGDKDALMLFCSLIFVYSPYQFVDMPINSISDRLENASNTIEQLFDQSISELLKKSFK